MSAVSSRELKNRTGEVLRRVRRGERIAVTNRGRRIAVIMPVQECVELDNGDPQSCEEAWKDIIEALEASAPEEPSWRKAIARSRRRR